MHQGSQCDLEFPFQDLEQEQCVSSQKEMFKLRDLMFSILLCKQAAAGAKSDVQYKYHKLEDLCTCLVKREHVNRYLLIVMMDP